VAPSVGVEAIPINLGDAAEVERDIEAFGRSGNCGLIVAAAGDESRADPKPQDSQGARYCHSIATGWPRRRGDRMNGGMSAYGT
jgi:hypothetical protein